MVENNICGANLVKPIRELLSVTKGPPLSPWQTLFCHSPLAQIILCLSCKNGKLSQHGFSLVVFSSVYCKIDGEPSSLSFVLPLPMAITSISLVEEHAKEIGLITSLNSTGSGSLIRAISLLLKYYHTEIVSYLLCVL